MLGLVMQLATLLEAPLELPGALCSTGFRDLDELTGGFRRGAAWVVTGAPRAGKTTLACQWASALATAGVPVTLLAGHEMPRHLGAFVVAAHGRVPLSHLLHGALHAAPDEADRIARASREVSSLPISLGGRDTDELGDAHMKGGQCSAVIVDDLDLWSDSPQTVVPALRQRIGPDGVVVVTAPRHVVCTNSGPDQAWVRAVDVIVDLELCRDPVRSGELDMHVIHHRYGPVMSRTAAFQGHHARIVDL